MEPLKHFQFRSFKWHCEVWFYEDRIESAWDEWGLGVQKGKKTVLRGRLQPTITETSTFGFKARGSFYRVAQFLIIAFLVWLFAPENWRAWAWLPFVLALPPLVVAITRLKKREWLNLQTKDGAVALALDTSGWQPSEVSDFRDYFSNWIREPNQPVETTETAARSPRLT